MLAYGYTPEPPARPARHEALNVLYAEIITCQLHSLDHPDCPSNQTFRRRLEGWLKAAGSVYVWLYKVNFDSWCWVHPNLDTLADDLRYLRRVGVKGGFLQGNQMAVWGQRFFGEMNELRAYLIARLMWNPDLDWRELRREFCAAYYGPEAGACIEQYLDDLRQAFVEQNVHGGAGFGVENFTWITPAMIARWYAYLDQAEAATEDEEQRKLVRIARLPIQFTAAHITTDPEERQTRLQAYLDQARALGAAELLNEGYYFHDWANRLGLKWE